MQFIRQCFGMSKKVPQRIVDPHHHFYTPSVEAGPGGHSGFLRKLGAPDYPPEDYVKDKGSLNIVKSVHIEALPDDGVAEAAWVASLIKAGKAPTVKAIVGKVDLAAPDAAQKLEALVKTSDLVRGVRYIIDYDGPFGEDNGTHPEVSRHGKDYLRGPEASDFERGFALLKKHGLSYDLQCAPAQLPAAAALLARGQRPILTRRRRGGGRVDGVEAGQRAQSTPSPRRMERETHRRATPTSPSCSTTRGKYGSWMVAAGTPRRSRLGGRASPL